MVVEFKNYDVCDCADGCNIFTEKLSFRRQNFGELSQRIQIFKRIFEENPNITKLNDEFIIAIASEGFCPVEFPNGKFYTDGNDIVTACWNCCLVCSQWQEDDDPVVFHRTKSSNCKLSKIE